MSDHSELRRKVLGIISLHTEGYHAEIITDCIMPIIEAALEAERAKCELIEADAVKYAAALGRAEEEALKPFVAERLRGL